MNEWISKCIVICVFLLQNGSIQDLLNNPETTRMLLESNSSVGDVQGTADAGS